MATKETNTHEPDELFNDQRTRQSRPFDVDVTIEADKRSGEVIVRMDLDDAEAAAFWEKMQGDGHQYPEDVRERVLTAMGCNVQGAGRGK